MVRFHYLKKDKFHEARAGRIGASDVPAILPNPEKPTESLAGYDRTAITVYKEKRGELQGPEPNLNMEMGHYNENKSAELLIRRFWNEKDAALFRVKKEQFESRPDAHAANYQLDPWYHSTEYHYDGMVVHPDLVYRPNGGEVPDIKVVDGIPVDLTNPFLVECKSARLMATKRHPGTFVKGYDFDLTTWHGIPLKHYVQVQFQLALMQVNTGYLSLIYDTSSYQCWEIDANKKWQGRIMDVVGRMIKHIETGTIPKELAMNAKDIQEIYPKIDHDYCMVSEGNEDSVKKACVEYRKAGEQEKKWKERKKDAQDSLAIHLKGFEEIRSGSDSMAKWTTRQNKEKMNKGISDIKKNDPATYRYLLRKGYIKPGDSYRFVKVNYKEG